MQHEQIHVVCVQTVEGGPQTVTGRVEAVLGGPEFSGEEHI